CYLIETCPHAREASYTQSMKVTCRDCANACSEFLPRRQQCFGHCEPTHDLRPNHACEPFALENFATKLPRGRRLPDLCQESCRNSCGGSSGQLLGCGLDVAVEEVDLYSQHVGEACSAFVDVVVAAGAAEQFGPRCLAGD